MSRWGECYGQRTAVGICRRSGCRDQIGLAAADRPAVAVAGSSVQKASFSSTGEGLKCQTEIGSLGKGDPSKASEQD